MLNPTHFQERESEEKMSMVPSILLLYTGLLYYHGDDLLHPCCPWKLCFGNKKMLYRKGINDPSVLATQWKKDLRRDWGMQDIGNYDSWNCTKAVKHHLRSFKLEHKDEPYFDART